MNLRFNLTFLLLFVLLGTAFAEEIRRPEEYRYHLQGTASDGNSIFWTFTDVLVKTDMQGNLVKEIQVPSHHGDCCVEGGKLYVSTHMNWPRKDATSWIYVYDCADLAFVTKYPLAEYDQRGVDGITFHDGHFYICIGKDPKDMTPFNLVIRTTPDFQIVQKIEVPGTTVYGIQTLNWAGGFFWCGNYGRENTHTQQWDRDFKAVVDHRLDLSTGCIPLEPTAAGEIRLLVTPSTQNAETKKFGAVGRTAILRDGILRWED